MPQQSLIKVIISVISIVCFLSNILVPENNYDTKSLFLCVEILLKRLDKKNNVFGTFSYYLQCRISTQTTLLICSPVLVLAATSWVLWSKWPPLRISTAWTQMFRTASLNRLGLNVIEQSQEIRWSWKVLNLWLVGLVLYTVSWIEHRTNNCVRQIKAKLDI